MPSLITTVFSQYTTSLPSIVFLASDYATGASVKPLVTGTSISGQRLIVTSITASIGSAEININPVTSTSLYWTLPKGSLTITLKIIGLPSNNSIRIAALLEGLSASIIS